jgi:hypothetical protein
MYRGSEGRGEGDRSRKGRYVWPHVCVHTIEIPVKMYRYTYPGTLTMVHMYVCTYIHTCTTVVLYMYNFKSEYNQDKFKLRTCT